MGKEIHKTRKIVRILQMKLLPLIIQSTVNGYAFRVTRQTQFSTICFVQTSEHIIIFSLNQRHRLCVSIGMKFSVYADLVSFLCRIE